MMDDESKLGSKMEDGVITAPASKFDQAIIPVQVDVVKLSYSIMMKKTLGKDEAAGLEAGEARSETSGCLSRSSLQETFFLNSITTSFRPKTMTAVMGKLIDLCVWQASCVCMFIICIHIPSYLSTTSGPSGAGKTTLMSVLLGEASGQIHGEIKINGRPLKEVAKQFKKLVTLVPQDDTLLTSLTPLETLTFASKLRLPSTLPK